ncbi:MAG: hypothetical protein Q9227_008529 [Pyrenula ochraceoflavens]
MDFSGCAADTSLGPAVQGCRDNFDFTIRFERTYLSLVPACLFIALTLVFTHVHAALQLSLLVLSARPRRLQAWFLSSFAVAFVASLATIIISLLEHTRARRPPILLNTYLFLTLLFDIAQTRTFWLAATNDDELVFSRLYTASVAVKLCLIIFESRRKSQWMQWDAKCHSPEETSGIFDLGTFVWLYRVFVTGFKKVLHFKDLPPLDQLLRSETLGTKLMAHMEAAPEKGKKFRLASALAKTIGIHLLLPVGPRLAWTGFKFCQPFLINTLLDYLQQSEETSDKNIGYGLIGATIVIYTGIAFSTALYWYFHERTLCMARGALAAAVYKKTTEAQISAVDNSAALTLMSTDVEKIRYGFINLHELFYANVIEVGLACWLVQRQLGTAFVAPLIVVICCTVGMVLANRYTSRRQKKWMAKIQTRVGLTANAISNMKHLKMSGLTPPVEELIQNMRVDELKTSSAFRTVHIIVLAFAYAPLALSPVMTFAVTSQTLNISTIFTSISWLLLLTDPLTYLFQNSPHLVAAFACLDRIQDFLEMDSRIDFRDQAIERASNYLEKEGSDLEVGRNGCNPLISISDGNFGWQQDHWSLTSINLAVTKSQLAMVVGPVASGKSTLCRVLLGEVPFAQGRTLLNYDIDSGRIGYCDQAPCLSNGSIRENIIGFATFNDYRYKEIIKATMLELDLSLLPTGDKTKIGSNGVSLSGGQKQRVSLARALYIDTNFFVIDDILSGLDADTADRVFHNVFGPGGMLRRRNATTVLCTHAANYLPYADHIIALEANGSIAEQGTFQDLAARDGYVRGLNVKQVRTGGIEDDNTPDRIERTGVSEAPEVALNDIVASSYMDERDRMTGDSTVYRHYLATLGTRSIAAFIVFGFGWGFFYNWGNVWLKFWSEDVSSRHPSRSNSFYIGLYTVFQVSYLASMVLCFLVCYRTMIQISGGKLHKAALSTVMSAPFTFFTTTDTGVIINLFSQDMTLIDNELPVALTNLVLDVCNAVAMAVVVATSSPFLALVYPPIFVVFAHFLDTIRGLATFRAFGWIQDGMAFNNRLLDTSQRPFYLLYMVQRWLGFVLKIIVAMLAVSVVTLSTQVHSSTTLTGASLVTLMTFGDVLDYIIRWWTQLETSIGAISRLKNFSEKVKSENLEGEDITPPEQWPLNGDIKINGVSASYSIAEGSARDPDRNCDESAESIKNFALKDLQLNIRPREKIAICGRSGSGKSSTLLLLLRLLEPLPAYSENISIDSMPLHLIERDTLRRRIIAVPQEPVFLPAGTSLLSQLDPFKESDEHECCAALKTVGLDTLIDHGEVDLHRDLDTESLSQGQKQLFGLARAVLRRRIRMRGRERYRSDPAVHDRQKEIFSPNDGGILLLDEVSSSVDQNTEREVQQIIHDEFEGYTIVMVSHRLEMIMNFDTVVVMDRGSVVEKGEPRSLVGKEGSRFRDLWMVQNGEQQGKDNEMLGNTD